MHYISIFLVGICALGVSSTYRLPRSVLPSHYKLDIFTYLGVPNNFNFEGTVAIQAICFEKTQNITLHAKNLTIGNKDVKVKDISGSEATKVDVANVVLDKENDFVIIELGTDLKPEHNYEITIAFKGVMDDSLAGFYKSSYTDQKSKEKKWLGVTQFESISARKAFPCFDEPAMKATFEISIGRKEGLTSLSNMPLISTTPIKEKEGFYLDRFEQSVPMSTYLVAFVVSDFGSRTSEPIKDSNVTFKIWARKEALNQVEFAKDVGPKSLAYYEEFFGIKYPLPKQDMIAIPDFNAGAMENWGLITYREALLLFDPEVSSITSQHRVASVISHELAHQWFGNLVTMEWWTDLWLNEGFATYMAGLAVEHLFPEWNSLQEEAVNNLLNVFSFDSLRSSHPVRVPIGHPQEIEGIFDAISYKKGSFLIRMMSLFLGEETLRVGVSNYLKEHKFGNAEQDHLWSALTDVAHTNGNLPKNLTVKTVMDTWTVQTGYPLITVIRDYEKKTAAVSQDRFLKDAVKTQKSSDCWWVPLSYTDGVELAFDNAKPKSWLSCPKNSHTIENLHGDSWVLFNIQIANLYKINYDEKNWYLLIKTLESPNYKKIPTLNRVQLIDDASDLSWTGDLKYDVYFDLLKYLKNEDEYLPWRSALSNINLINKQLKMRPSYGDFKVYMRELLTPIYEKVGGLVLNIAKANKLDAVKHQLLIVGWACRFEVANCVADAKAVFDQWQTNPEKENPIHKDLRGVVYCTAIRHGNEKEWDFVWKQYKKSNVATEKSTILGTLGCTQEIWVLSRYLQWSLEDDSGIRKQDSTSVFTSVAANHVAHQISKSFFFKNIDRISKHLSGNTRRLKSFLTAIAHQVTSQEELVELKSFVDKNQKYMKDIKKGVDQALESAKIRADWSTNHLTEVEELLKKYNAQNDKV